MVEDITDFTFFYAEKKTQTLLQTVKNNGQLISPSRAESQLREEIQEKNELIEIVAQRINQLVSKFDNENTTEYQKPSSIKEVKEEISRCLSQIGAKEWIEMCYYDDYKFFIKLYPKLEGLYNERFGESEKFSNNTKDGKEIMAIKMVRLGFPEEVETVVIKYVAIRNTFQHSMNDISPSNLELSRDVFAKVFVYLMLSSIDSKFLLKNREMLYANLTDFFSKRLTGNPAFRKRLLKRFETVFQA